LHHQGLTSCDEERDDGERGYEDGGEESVDDALSLAEEDDLV